MELIKDTSMAVAWHVWQALPIRLVAEGALSVLGKSAVIKAREDVKLKGEKIYLG